MGGVQYSDTVPLLLLVEDIRSTGGPVQGEGGGKGLMLNVNRYSYQM